MRPTRSSAPPIRTGRHDNGFFLVAILFIGISVAYLDRVNIAVIAANPEFLADMGITGQPVKVGLMMSLFLVAYAISNVVLSPLGDYLGPRKAMVTAYVIMCASLLTGGMAATFGMLLATLLIMAVSLAAVVGWWLMYRDDKRRRRDMQMAMQENG